MAELLRAHRAGDPAALNALVDQLRPRLLRYAQSILRDETLAEDAFVDAMTELLPRLPSIEHPEALTTYALRTTRCRALDLLRRGEGPRLRAALAATDAMGLREPGRSTAPIERLGGPDPEPAILSAERRALIWSEVDALPEPERSLVQRVYRDGLEIAAAATAVGVPERSAYRALASARARLALRLSSRLGRSS